MQVSYARYRPSVVVIKFVSSRVSFINVTDETRVRIEPELPLVRLATGDAGFPPSLSLSL